MEHRRPGGLHHLVVGLGCVVLLATTGAGQAQTRGAPIGAEAIKRMLTGHKQWTFYYWDRDPVTRPRLAAWRRMIDRPGALSRTILSHGGIPVSQVRQGGDGAEGLLRPPDAARLSGAS